MKWAATARRNSWSRWQKWRRGTEESTSPICDMRASWCSTPVREAIAIGELAKIPVWIFPIKSGTVAGWNRTGEGIRLAEDAHGRGVDVTADCYPYDAWSSTIKVLVADKKYENRESVKNGLDDVGGARNVTVTACAPLRGYEFRTLWEIARTKGVTPIDIFTQVVNDGGAGVVVKAMVDSDIKAIYRQRWLTMGVLVGAMAASA